MSLPPLECLVAALTAARLGSFSAAAEELGVTQATIGRRVAGAESWAGVTLFDRQARGVSATVEGQRLLARIAQSLEEINAAAERDRAPRRRPVVRVSVTPSFARFWLIPRLAALECDDVTIEIVAEMRTADLERGEVDLAVRYGRGGWRVEREEALFDERIAPVALESAFPSLAGAEARDLAELPLLHNHDTRGWRAWGDHHGLDVRRKAIDRLMSDSGLVVDAVAQGMGVGLWLSSLQRVEEAPAGLLVRTDLTAPSPTGYHLLMRAARPGGAAETVAARIREQAGEANAGAERGREAHSAEE
jgi:DNA-binding transcriptional LysR family regulator